MQRVKKDKVEINSRVKGKMVIFGLRNHGTVDRIRVYAQVYNTITIRLLSNPWQTAP